MSTECAIEQVQVCNKSFENIEEKIKVQNHRIEDLENKTEEINNIGKVLVELQLLTQLQREDSIKRDKAIEDMNKTQNDMNKNQIEITNTLKTLTASINKTDEAVVKLDEKVDGNQKETNNKFDEMSKNNSIDVPSLIKKIIMVTITVVITSGITYAFAK